MYKLTLTSDERKAMDWVGHRYFHGDDLETLLWDCRRSCVELAEEWDGDQSITFLIPEHVSWEIREGLESEDSFCTCFGPELTAKLREFCDNIV